MIWFVIGIISLILGLYYRKKKGDFGNRVVVNGEITKVCETEHCVYVKYEYDKETFAAMCLVLVYNYGHGKLNIL